MRKEEKKRLRKKILNTGDCVYSLLFSTRCKLLSYDLRVLGSFEFCCTTIITTRVSAHMYYRRLAFQNVSLFYPFQEPITCRCIISHIPTCGFFNPTVSYSLLRTVYTCMYVCICTSTVHVDIRLW